MRYHQRCNVGRSMQPRQVEGTAGMLESSTKNESVCHCDTNLPAPWGLHAGPKAEDRTKRPPVRGLGESQRRNAFTAQSTNLWSGPLEVFPTSRGGPLPVRVHVVSQKCGHRLGGDRFPPFAKRTQELDCASCAVANGVSGGGEPLVALSVGQ